MKQIEVGGAAPYTVQVGAGLLSSARVPERQVVLIHAEDLPIEFVEQVEHNLQTILTVRVPARDACKTLEVYAGVLSQLAQMNLPRDGAVVGLGGGAATDLARLGTIGVDYDPVAYGETLVEIFTRGVRA